MWLTQQKPACEGNQNRFAGTLTCVMPKHSQSTHRVVLPALCCQTLGADNRNNTLNCCWFNKHCKYMRDSEEKATPCFWKKLLKLSLEWLRFHITTFSHLRIIIIFCLPFESKTCSLTCSLFLWFCGRPKKPILLFLAKSLGLGRRSQMFPSIFSAPFLWLCVQRAWGCARVLPTSEALVPVHPEPQRWPLKEPPPSPHYPDSESYSASAVFPRVCLMCAVRCSDCSEGSGWTGPHRAPHCVDTVAYPEAWQQPLKRGSRETDQALGADLLPHAPPPWTGEAPALTAELSAQSQIRQFHPTGLYCPAGRWLFARCEVHLFETSPGMDGDMWPESGMRKITRGCADGSLTLLTLTMATFCCSRNQSKAVWADSMEPSHQ